ncbi:Myc-type basic helix-loop-helix (bHLH) domain [Trinorchestia longiramus]|nr:Myc-type basic helix-loop-helix (bHLH) domain [Trinorchestia longiramus]
MRAVGTHDSEVAIVFVVKETAELRSFAVYYVYVLVLEMVSAWLRFVLEMVSAWLRFVLEMVGTWLRYVLEMELRAETSGEKSEDCCPSSATETHSDTTSANGSPCLHFPPVVPSSQYSSSLCHGVPVENVSGDCERVVMLARYRGNQGVEDGEKNNVACQSVSRSSHQVSGSMFSDEILLPVDNDDKLLDMQHNNQACDHTSWQARRQASDRSSPLLPPSRRNCSIIVKHFRPVFTRKRGSNFKQSLSKKSLLPMDKCSTDSRLSSNSLMNCITNAASLTTCRSLKSLHRAESPSHLIDLCSSNSTPCDSERTTPSHSPHNDGAIDCNKAHTLSSVHSLHRDKELPVDGYPALRSSLQPSWMIKSSDSLDISALPRETPNTLISSGSFAVSHGRLSKDSEACEQADAVGSCTKLVPRRDRIRKFRTSGRRKLKLRRREYGRLRDMVPSLKTQPAVSKVTLIEEAVKYIEELHGALIQRFRARGLPPTLAESRDVVMRPPDSCVSKAVQVVCLGTAALYINTTMPS